MTSVDLMKCQIEAQLDDYERAIGEYAAFMGARRPKPRTVMFTDELRAVEAAE